MYLDDTLTFTPHWQQHPYHLFEVLSGVNEVNLMVKLAKTIFGLVTVNHNGHGVGGSIFGPNAAITTVSPSIR